MIERYFLSLSKTLRYPKIPPGSLSELPFNHSLYARVVICSMPGLDTRIVIAFTRTWYVFNAFVQSS